MAFKFGRKSLERISKIHPLLQEFANATLARSPYDISIISSAGLRTAEDQNKLFKEGRSKCDGYEKISFHQSGKAIDLVPYINGGPTWENDKAFLGIANAAFEAWDAINDKQGFHLHWGGYWGAVDLDKDGVLDLDDKLGWDMPHFELRKYPQTKGVYPVEWA